MRSLLFVAMVLAHCDDEPAPPPSRPACTEAALRDYPGLTCALCLRRLEGVCSGADFHPGIREACALERRDCARALRRDD